MSTGSSQQLRNQQSDHSYDLVLDHLRERVAAQFEQVNVLDTKAGGLMTIASALLAAALVLQAAWLSLSGKSISTVFTKTEGIFIALLVVYILMMIVTVLAGYWILPFNRVPEPAQLQTYALKPKLETQSSLVGSMTTAFNKNKPIIAFKVWCLRIATILLIGEIILLGVLLFMQIYQ